MYYAQLIQVSPKKNWLGFGVIVEGIPLEGVFRSSPLQDQPRRLHQPRRSRQLRALSVVSLFNNSSLSNSSDDDGVSWYGLRTMHGALGAMLRVAAGTRHRLTRDGTLQVGRAMRQLVRVATLGWRGITRPLAAGRSQVGAIASHPSYRRIRNDEYGTIVIQPGKSGLRVFWWLI